MTATVPALLQPLKDRLAAAREWDVCDGEQTVRAETGEIIYDRSGYDRSEWVGEYRPIAEFIASAPTDQAKLIAAVEAADGETAWWANSNDTVLRGAAFHIRAALTQALGGDTA